MYDKILERLNLRYEDLTREERNTLNSWMQILEKKRITTEDVKKYISTMKESVENELTKTDINSKQDIFLKARLRNYILLDAFLYSPERAKDALERMVEGIVPKR